MTPSSPSSSHPSPLVSSFTHHDFASHTHACFCEAFIPLLAALFTTNFYLGKTQNAVDGKLHPMYRQGETPVSDDSSSSHDEKSSIPEKETPHDSA